MALALVAGVLAIATPTAEAAGPWFVAKTGNDGNTCLSGAAPCLTIGGALAKASAGDTINVGTGQYDERLGITKAIDIVATNPGTVTIHGQGSAALIGPTIAVLLPAANQPVRLAGVAVTGGFNVVGGGLVNFLGAVTLDDVDLHGSTASFGGGVFVGAGASLTLNGGRVRNNIAANGGGLYGYGEAAAAVANVSFAGSGAVITVNGTELDNNQAVGLAATANTGNGGGILSSGALTVTGATFARNRAILAGGSSALRGYGGAILAVPLDADDEPTAVVSGTTITNGLPAGTATALAGGGVSAMGNLFSAVGASPATLTLTNTSISGQRATSGGGVHVGGTATITGGSISGNVATSNGGGIWNEGVTTLAGAVVDNDAGLQGGGVYSAALNPGGATPLALNLQSATLTDNAAANAGGGLIALAPTALNVTGSSFTTNAGIGGGAAVVWINTTATFTDTTFTGNTATGSGAGANLGGGAILNSGTTNVVRGSFTGNKSGAAGGAIANGGITAGVTSTLNVTDATFSGNEALPSANSAGGAIYNGFNPLALVTNHPSRATISGSTFTGNTAQQGAALFTLSGLSGSVSQTHVERSTIHANTATVAASGAVTVLAATSISSSTITDNAPRNLVGAVASLSVSGSIVSRAAGTNCSAAITSGGWNLTDPGEAVCGFSGAKNDQFVAHQLGALAGNGGPTQTREPGPSSPAINRIPVNTATGVNRANPPLPVTPVVLCATGAVDQRGVVRPQGDQSLCDIGAVEADLADPVISGVAELDLEVGVGMTPELFTTVAVPTATLAHTGGTLPAGLTFTPTPGGGGTLAGTPTAPGGESTITLTATNSEGTDTHTVTIRVHEAPAMSGPSAATFTVGEFGESDLFFQTAGFPDAVYTATGTLPAGVTLVDNGDGTAQVEGTPADGTGGEYVVTIVADNGTAPDASSLFTLTVEEAPEIDGLATVTMTVGTAGSTTYDTDGFPEATLALDPASILPGGVTFTDDADGTGTLAGTPDDGTGGEYELTVTATNGVDPDASFEVLLIVEEAPELAGTATFSMVVGVEDSTGYVASGFPTATLSATGGLPAGVTFEDNGDGTATLGGAPAGGSVGTYTIQVTATNGVAPDATMSVEITVEPHVIITTTSLPDGSVGVAYAASVVAADGLPPYAFEVTSGSLPAGLSMGTNGAISGTPTGPGGTSTFTVEVTDSAEPAQTDTQELSITIGGGETTLLVAPVLIEVRGILGLRIQIGRVTGFLFGGTPPAGIGGQTIVFKAGATTVCTAVTAPDGTVTCTMTPFNTLRTVLNLGVTAHYAGNGTWDPTSASAGLLG